MFSYFLHISKQNKYILVKSYYVILIRQLGYFNSSTLKSNHSVSFHPSIIAFFIGHFLNHDIYVSPAQLRQTQDKVKLSKVDRIKF